MTEENGTDKDLEATDPIQIDSTQKEAEEMEDLHWCTLEAISSNAETFQIAKDTCTLGRSDDNDKIFKNNRFSGRHCTIKREKAEGDKCKYLVEDLSSNGTFVNGNKIGKGNKKEVRSGDQIALLNPDKQTENGIGTHNTIDGLIFILKLTEDNLFAGIKRDHSEEDAVKEVAKSSPVKRPKQDEMINGVEEKKKVIEETQPPKSENKSLDNNLEEEKKSPEESKAPNDTAYLNDMQCGICIDLMYQAVSLMPCLHNVKVGVEFSFVALVIRSG